MPLLSSKVRSRPEEDPIVDVAKSEKMASGLTLSMERKRARWSISLPSRTFLRLRILIVTLFTIQSSELSQK